jgi:hypothetical protein
MAELTRKERDALLSRARGIKQQLYPTSGARPAERAAKRLRETYYQILAEYADRLPRTRLSTCPFTGEPFIHSFDPWGVDGPWWESDREMAIEEPKAPETFRVLQGALGFHGRKPSEADDAVMPGPEVPFVIPRLLGLPEMVAVVTSVQMTSGDTAYPITYFSPVPMLKAQLHREWRAAEYWYEDEDGDSMWRIDNDPWDFDLAPWIASGKLRWIVPGDDTWTVVDGRSGAGSPFLNVAGDRFPQSLCGGERDLLDLPDGTIINPFEE